MEPDQTESGPAGLQVKCIFATHVAQPTLYDPLFTRPSNTTLALALGRTLRRIV